MNLPLDRQAVTRLTRFELRCTKCATTMEPSVALIRCRDCSGTLVVDRSRSDFGNPNPMPSIELGQGNTPTVPLESLCSELGIAALSAKLEFLSPTGSFKDRGSALLMAVAAAEGVTEFVEDSSGNAGASMAAYAAAAGIKAHIFAPASAARGKLDQIRVFGAELHAIPGPRQAATDAATAYAEQRRIPYLSHALSPWFIEGMRSFANEVLELPKPPTDIVLPVGNGSLLLGMDSLWTEMVSDFGGRITVPRIHAVQTVAIHPLAARIRGETDHLSAGDTPSTVASGISVTVPPRLDEMEQAMRRHGGDVATVEDIAILGWQRRLAAAEGLFCEATSAAALAGLELLTQSGAVTKDARVLIPLTGSGLKEPLAEVR